MTQTLITDLDTLLDRAAAAAPAWAATDRAPVLEAVASALQDAAAELIPLAHDESHLPLPRLENELRRTTFQLELFARQVRDDTLVRRIDDTASPDWPTGPRPALHYTQLPIGPVVVFAASNFPFAFSVAGGDTASAWAAGCPVLVKAHPGHPRLSDATAAVITRALESVGAPAGAFGLFHGDEAGRRAVLDPRIAAAAFTGSTVGGRALFDLAVSRPDPIPFYGELGSTNPVFVTEAAARDRGAQIAQGYVGSFTLGCGQFCTKPGLLLVPAGSGIAEAAAAEVAGRSGAALLNDRISAGFSHTLNRLRSHPGVRTLVEGGGPQDSPLPTLLATDVLSYLADPEVLGAECFGPASLIVEYTDEGELLDFAEGLEGQLTATVHGEPTDAIAPALIAAIARHAGRVLWNDWPTGVSVTPAMMHGGPYPASTSPLHTSVGTTAAARFLRPVAFQQLPAHLLPPGC